MVHVGGGVTAKPMVKKKVMGKERRRKKRVSREINP
jgi:hypothetical protein